MIEKTYYTVKEIAIGRDPVSVMGSEYKVIAEDFARDMNEIMEKYDLRTRYEVEKKILKDIK